MFKRSFRLSRDAFLKAQKTGRRLSSSNFSVIQSDVFGYAVVISKKVARLSVTRHKMKRRVLEALRTISLPAGLIVFPRAEVANMKYDEIRSELATLLK